jgi:hypothetical protein
MELEATVAVYDMAVLVGDPVRYKGRIIGHVTKVGDGLLGLVHFTMNVEDKDALTELNDSDHWRFSISTSVDLEKG